MTTEEIKKNAPIGATHYLTLGAIDGVDFHAYYKLIGKILFVFDFEWVCSDYNFWQLGLKPL